MKVRSSTYYEIISVLMVVVLTTALSACDTFMKKKEKEVQKTSGKGAISMVLISTNLGDIKVKLNEEKAPVTVDNFLAYVREGFYDGVIFHRVIPGFMIQTGGFTEDMVQKPTKQPIENEAKNGLLNKKGSLAMARTSDINSATSQFFINLVDNSFLDHGHRDYGYAVFGEVVGGMDVVDKIGAAETGNLKNFRDVPKTSVVIKSVTVMEDK